MLIFDCILQVTDRACSGPILEASHQSGRSGQRHSRPGGRHIFRGVAQCVECHDIRTHLGRPIGKRLCTSCFGTVLTTVQPALAKLFVHPTWDNFVATTTLCGYASFLFGYHVHEKAILLVIIPFSLLALKDRRYLGAFRPLAVAGHVSLFPLLFTAMEFPVKVVYTMLWLITFLLAFDQLAPA